MAEETQRRLAAIVLADVVGYSRLMGADEASTLEAMRAHRRELWDPTIERYGGRIVNRAGDSALTEFASAVAAMECSVAIQNAMAERNEAIPDDKRIELRFGVNVGEVVVDGEEIYGDGVNVAARLQTLAEPGGIALSGNVHENIANRLDLILVDEGEHQVKNIARPVHVWRWSPNVPPPMSVDAATPTGVSATLALPDKPSIAVLPFDNMSGDPEQEFFADGIAEDVITALSRFRSLFVIARNSTFTYKGRAVDITKVAGELGVRYVVEGSVRKAGNRVRITAQLIDAASGNHIWADRFDGTLEDIFDLQDRITEQIVVAVAPEIEAHERERARRQPPDSLDAWELYQRGLWHFYNLTKEDLPEARRLFEQSIARDPGFSSPHAGIAISHFFERFQGYADDPARALDLGLEAGEKAVSLDDRDGFAHLALGRVLMLRGDGARAIAELEKSVSLNPSFAHGYYSLGLALNFFGRSDEGLAAAKMAIRLSPRDPILWGMHAVCATCAVSLGDYKEAEEWARKAANARPDIWQNQYLLATALLMQDRLEEGRKAADAALKAKPDLTISFVRELFSHAGPKYWERRVAALRKVGFPE